MGRERKRERVRVGGREGGKKISRIGNLFLPVGRSCLQLYNVIAVITYRQRIRITFRTCDRPEERCRRVYQKSLHTQIHIDTDAHVDTHIEAQGAAYGKKRVIIIIIGVS